MEKTDRMAVVAGQFRWSDIGSWGALFDITTPRSRWKHAAGRRRDVDSSDCIMHSHDRLTDRCVQRSKVAVVLSSIVGVGLLGLILATGSVSRTKANALGLNRSTAWTIIKTKHKSGRLNRKTVRSTLTNRNTPLAVRVTSKQCLMYRSKL